MLFVDGRHVGDFFVVVAFGEACFDVAEGLEGAVHIFDGVGGSGDDFY